jgi:sugar phosphate permease
METVKST